MALSPLLTGCSQAEIDAYVDHALQEMTLAEKVGVMTGAVSLLRLGWDVFFRRHYNEEPYGTHPVKRLGLPDLRFSDGPRGAVVGHSTCFPVSIARGASFDRQLEERIGEAIARELRAQGANYYGGVCINLLRHPAWGRAQETYGEDPFLLGEMGAALVHGIQKHNLIACIKHYALNSIENSRFQVNVRVSPRTLREVYLPHFKRCIEAGAASVMAAYNRVEGDYCCENKMLLTDILRDEWGFEGFVISDFFYGIYDTRKAVQAGLDVEMPSPRFYGSRLARLVRAGQVKVETIDQAVRRIMRTLLFFDTRPDPEEYSLDRVLAPEHLALAQEAAEKSMVLLKNDGILPFDRTKTVRVALLGRLGAEANLGDHGSSRVYPPRATTPLQGLVEALPGIPIDFVPGDDLAAARYVARQASVVVVVVGNTYLEEGEYMTSGGSLGGDRNSLRLRDGDVALIRTALEVNPRTLVVLEGGGPILISEWKDAAPAILLAFYPGMQGGAALARLLFGEVNPSGKLPFSIAKSESDYPVFDSHADEIEYGYYHGYTLLEREGKQADFPFGFGLSYSSFDVRDVRVVVTGNHAQISARVCNTGTRPGATVVQAYVGVDGSAVDRPEKLLKGFERLELKPGEEHTVKIPLARRALSYYDETGCRWVEEDLQYRALVGFSSRPEDLTEVRFRFGGD